MDGPELTRPISPIPEVSGQLNLQGARPTPSSTRQSCSVQGGQPGARNRVISVGQWVGTGIPSERPVPGPRWRTARGWSVPPS